MNPRIVLIGDVFLDVMLTRPINENKMRLGGIIHAARALWALGITYDLLYIAPQYLHGQIEEYAHIHGAHLALNIGIVFGAPNVAIISEPKEAGPQGYEVLLREKYKTEIDQKKLEQALDDGSITDIIIFPGEYDLTPILISCKACKAKVHIDIAHGVEDINILRHLGKKFDTGIESTSSSLFIDQCEGSIEILQQKIARGYFRNLLFKENRGGVRLFSESNPPEPIGIGAQVRPIVHSVGVGDCFDAAYIALSHVYDAKVALTYASWIAGEYASTTYPDDFRVKCNNVMLLTPSEIVELKGIFVPWETRPSFNIYIAAPDFDYMDKSVINTVIKSLTYHNFKPRPPVRENGQLRINASIQEKQATYDADLSLLLECQLVLAIMINDDPGTNFEIGYAVGVGIPVLIYDPQHRVNNPMLSQSAYLVSSDLDEVIGQVFELASMR